MTRNILIPRKRKFFFPGGDLNGINGTSIDWTGSNGGLSATGSTLTQTYQVPQSNAPKLTINQNQNKGNIDKTLGKDLSGSLKGVGNGSIAGSIANNANDVVQTFIDASNKNQTGDHTKDNLNTFKAVSDKIAEQTGPYGQVVNAAVSGFVGGATNYDKGKADTQINLMKEQEKQANNVAQQYTAGQNKLNLMNKKGTAYRQNQLKTGKVWKNVLGATASGAAAGAAIGGPWGALIGGAIGAAGAGIGSILGRKKREKSEKQMAEAKRNEDYAVDYYNSMQAEQLNSANDNAAKVIADQNRQSILNLVAYGGKLRRKNVLLNKRNKLC